MKLVFTVQSVAFEKENWNKTDARNWLREHNFKPIKRVDPNNRFLRYRLEDPDKFTGFRVKLLPDGIRFLLGIK